VPFDFKQCASKIFITRIGTTIMPTIIGIVAAR
jgi:hypothetical protein